MSEKIENQNEIVGIPINYRVLPRTPSFNSNRALFYRGEFEEVVMTFFEIVPPYPFENPEAAMENLKNVGINAESQVRITLRKELFMEFAESISKLANHMKNKGA